MPVPTDKDAAIKRKGLSFDTGGHSGLFGLKCQAVKLAF